MSDTESRLKQLLWRTLDERVVLNVPPWLSVSMEQIQLPNGQLVDDFLRIDMPDYVVIVAMNDDNMVLVTHNYKHGPGRVCINLPAGYLAPDEEPRRGAERELLEETGHTASSWHPLGRFSSDGNRGSGTGHLYLARNAKQVREPNSGDLEEMLLASMSLSELVEATQRGDVAVLSNAAAIGLAAVTLLNPEHG